MLKIVSQLIKEMNENGWLTFLAFVVSIILFILSKIDNRKKETNDQIKEELSDPEDRKIHINRIRGEERNDAIWLQNYRLQVRRLSSFLDRFFGPPLSFSAFDRTFLLSLVYCISLFLISFSISGQVAIGSFSIVSESQYGIIFRILNLIAIAAYLFMYYSIFRRINIISAVIALPIYDRVTHGTKNIKWFSRLRHIIGYIIYFFTFCSVLGGANKLSLSNNHLASILFLSLLIFLIARMQDSNIKATGMGVFVVITLMAFFTILVFTYNPKQLPGKLEPYSYLHTFFFMALPFANAPIDYLSITISRFFIKKAAHIKQSPMSAFYLFMDIVYDLAFAVLCLIGLAVILPIAVYIFSFGSSIDGIIITAIEEAKEYPLGRGLFISSILFTTMLPTIVHISFGLYGVLLSMKPLPSTARELLSDTEPPSPMSRKNIMRYIFSRKRWSYLKYLVSAVMVIALLGVAFLVMRWLSSWLASIAIWSTNCLWHGHCSFVDS